MAAAPCWANAAVVGSVVAELEAVWADLRDWYRYRTATPTPTHTQMGSGPSLRVRKLPPPAPGLVAAIGGASHHGRVVGAGPGELGRQGVAQGLRQQGLGGLAVGGGRGVAGQVVEVRP